MRAVEFVFKSLRTGPAVRVTCETSFSHTLPPTSYIPAKPSAGVLLPRPSGRLKGVEIALGSTNAVKVLALRWALERLGLNVEPRPVEVPSGVADQPLSEAETVAGALARARAAREALGAALGVGIEGGVDLEGGWVVNVAAVEDGARSALGRSPGVRLPADWLAALRAGESLGELIEARYGPEARTLGAMGVFTGGALTRQEASAQAALAALGRYFALVAESGGE